MFVRMTNRTEGGIAYAKIPTNPSNMKLEKMKSNRHQRLKQQIRAFCPYPNHFCNGQPIPDEDGRKEAQKEPCEYYEFRGTFKSGCKHPERR